MFLRDLRALRVIVDVARRMKWGPGGTRPYRGLGLTGGPGCKSESHGGEKHCDWGGRLGVRGGGAFSGFLVQGIGGDWRLNWVEISEGV
jgi:hypothetical protein